MSGAYRDDREAARAKIAELQAELDRHRARRLSVAEMKKAVEAIANPRKITAYLLFAPMAAFVVLILGLTKNLGFASAISGLIAVAILSVVVHRSGGDALPPAGSNESEELLTRFRIAEAKTARVQLNDEQQRELDEEERICTALQEEIDQMKKLVER
jgi:hypothetical protein